MQYPQQGELAHESEDHRPLPSTAPPRGSTVEPPALQPPPSRTDPLPSPPLSQAKGAKADDATEEVTKLIETAAAKWRQEEGDYRDDITAICIKLQAMHDHHAASPAQ